MSSATSSSVAQLRANSCALPSRSKTVIVPHSNVSTLSRGRARASRCSASIKSTIVEKKFFGNRLRASGSERIHVWQSDGPGKSPKLRVMVRSALSGAPEKPLGLYDPAFEKDSCGVGFVAELSGESSRKTVRFCIYEKAHAFIW